MSKELFRRVDRLESGDLLPDIQVVAELDLAGQGDDERESDDSLMVATGVPPASPSAAPSSYRGPLAVELYREPDETLPTRPRIGTWPDDELDAEGDVEAPMPAEPVERPSSLNPTVAVARGRSIVDDPLHGQMALADWLGRIRG